MADDPQPMAEPAFPFVVRFDNGTFDPIRGRQMAPNEAVQHTFPGMSMRDWFAGQALAGWLASFGPDSAHPAESGHAFGVAQTAYQMADAMLAARKTGSA